MRERAREHSITHPAFHMPAKVRKSGRRCERIKEIFPQNQDIFLYDREIANKLALRNQLCISPDFALGRTMLNRLVSAAKTKNERIRFARNRRWRAVMRNLYLQEMPSPVQC